MDLPDGAEASDEFSRAWRQRSLRSGWTCPRDWWAPEVDVVAEAVRDGRALTSACERLGRSRGKAGVGVGETIDDLGALLASLRSAAQRLADPPLRLVRAAAEGWADTGLAGMQACEDPLTGLMTSDYLRSRLGECYRERSAVPVTDSHCLVVVDVGGADRWRRLARSVAIASVLRKVFPGGETLALVRPGRAAALARRGPELELQTAGLRVAMDRGRTWTERLPASHAEALVLLDRLARLSGSALRCRWHPGPGEGAGPGASDPQDLVASHA